MLSCLFDVISKFFNKVSLIIENLHSILYQIFAWSKTKIFGFFFGLILISFCHYFSLTLILYTSSFTKYEKKNWNKREQKKKRKKRLRKQLVCIYVRVKIRKKDLTKHRNTQERKKILKNKQTKNILRVCIKRKRKEKTKQR
jgi:uncharacterized membrane protein